LISRIWYRIHPQALAISRLAAQGLDIYLLEELLWALRPTLCPEEQCEHLPHRLAA
jgi:hypothetical protein